MNETTPPGSTSWKMYDNIAKCHHFNSSDHRLLGTDLASIFYKVLINTSDNNERMRTLIARYINYLHKGQTNALSRNLGEQDILLPRVDSKHPT